MQISTRLARSGLSFLVAAALIGSSCGQSAAVDGADSSVVLDDAGAAAPDLSTAPAADVCKQLMMPALPWNSAASGTLRDDVAGDFTITDQNGDWSFKSRWSGCESYVFIPDGMAMSSADATPMWSSDLDALIAASPPNVHYFFVSKKFDPAAAAASVAMVSGQVEMAISSLPDGEMPGQKGWWRKHLHFGATSARSISNWVGDLLGRSSTPEGFGFAIDRFQHVRGLGSFADVSRFDGTIDSNKNWPWGNNLAYAANPPVYFNYEATRQAKLDAQAGANVIKVYDHEIVKAPDPSTVPDGGVAPSPGTVYKDVTFPDAAALAKFDTLEVDLTMNCPTKNIPEEANNCGAWDYIVNISFLDDDGKTWIEMARFISSYHRAGRYFVDATQFLPILAKWGGGTRRMQYSWAPPWNEQPAETVMQFRLSNSGKGMRPVQSSYLFAGGGFNAMYNVGRMPVSVMIPAGAKKVELRAIISGHGGNTAANCSEFCDHHHVFTVGGMTFTKSYPEVMDSQGCMAKIGQGAVPNQSGTWWLGRGGWCPGMQVDPWIVDVTSVAKAGQAVSVSYQGTFNGKSPTVDLGTIDMNSWLVVWQ